MEQKCIVNISTEIKKEDLDLILKSNQFEKDMFRVVSNYSYDIVKEMVSSYMEEHELELKNVLRDKVLYVINNLSSYTVFHEKGIFDNDASYGTQILNNLILEMKPEIKERLKKTIEWAIDEKNANKIIKQTLHDLIDAVIKVNK